MTSREQLAVSGSRFLHGGSATPMALDTDERRALDALVDTLIPPEDGWPGAEELDVATLIARYVVPDAQELSLFPHVREAALRERLHGLGADFAAASLDDRVARLREVERTEPAAFGTLRDLVYYVYYGHPAVIALVTGRTRYGAGFRGAPQPDGYVDTTEQWGDRHPPQRGGFIPTEAVMQVANHRREG